MDPLVIIARVRIGVSYCCVDESACANEYHDEPEKIDFILVAVEIVQIK